MISFTIFGKPQPKERARVTNRLTRGGKRITVTPNHTRWAEEDFRIQAARHRPDKPMEGPIRLQLHFYCPIPKSWSKLKQRKAIDGEIFPTVTPDLDNLIKLIVDAMSQQFYLDDKQIVEIWASEYYGGEPRIEVELSRRFPCGIPVMDRGIDFTAGSEQK